MNAAAGRLTQAVLAALFVVGGAAAAALVLVAPRFLLIHPAAYPGALATGAAVGAASMALAVALTWLRLRRFRFTLRALGLGTRAIEPDEIEALDRAPAHITTTAALVPVAAAVLTLASPLRPRGVDFDSAASLTLLAVTFATTAALPLYVYVRRRVARAIQLAPDDVLAEVVTRAAATPRPAHRVVRRALLAVLAPVGLVGLGVALLAHAHVLAFEARERIDIAAAIAQGALEPVPGAVPTAGELDAAAAAAEHGFFVRLWEAPASFQVERRASGRVVLTVPLDLGHATVAFDATTILALTAGGILAALLATAIAAAVGAALGRSVADDLVHATRQVQLLGTESVLRGSARVARPARYAVVSALGEAIERLADRFRVFAEAQEQAIEAREAARRMRGLLFASVSHDLKSPLNSILGFADLVDDSCLAPGQRESLELIKRRGRELLALIQTILDAARVEAGQLVLDRRPASPAEIVRKALEQAAELTGLVSANVSARIDPALPLVEVDPARMVDALAALVAHALRIVREGLVRVHVRAPASGGEVVFDVVAPTSAISAADLARLMLPDGANALPRATGGLALGLSLARSLLVLHGGGVQALDVPEGVVLRAWVPAAD
jgi:signal transduction histidine kinase